MQMFSIVSSESDRGSLRLRFLAGGRVLAALGQSLRREQELSALLSVAPAEHARVADGLLQDKKASAKASKAAEEELSVLFASILVQRYEDAAALAVAAGSMPVPAVVLHRPGASLAFLQAAADCLLQLSEGKQLGLQVRC